MVVTKRSSKYYCRVIAQELGIEASRVRSWFIERIYTPDRPTKVVVHYRVYDGPNDKFGGPNMTEVFSE